jgi:hypothetical protein
MPDALGAHHHIDADRIAATDSGLHAVQRRGDRRGLGVGARRDFGFRFFTDGECGREFVLRNRSHFQRGALRAIAQKCPP